MDERKKGYIKLHRRILDWKYYKTDVATKVVWLHLLLTARFAETEGCRAGSLVCNYSDIAEETGVTVRQVRTALERLRETGEITVERKYRKVHIQVNKWQDYQEVQKVKKEQETTTEAPKRKPTKEEVEFQRKYGIRI